MGTICQIHATKSENAQVRINDEARPLRTAPLFGWPLLPPGSQDPAENFYPQDLLLAGLLSSEILFTRRAFQSNIIIKNMRLSQHHKYRPDIFLNSGRPAGIPPVY